MQPFVTTTGVAVPFLENDVNTDMIAPVGGGARISEDYAQTLFRSRRRLADGMEDPEFIFNHPRYRNPAIVVTGQNFGCGSSRESAVWALQAIGVRCIVARSFADIYRENCLQNGVLPIVLAEADAAVFERAVADADGATTFTVDLERLTIAGPNGFVLSFHLPAADRTRLLEGLDDIGLTLKHVGDIADWEARAARDLPWLQRALPGAQESA